MTTTFAEATRARATAAPPLREVPFAVTDPERIPSRRYYDEAFYKAEIEHLWPRVWQMACRLEEIPEIGDFVEYKIVGYSVIVVRTKDGIKAYHNSCRHRGAKLADGHGNCKTQGFVCPFHGWRWNMEGRNTFVFARDIFSEHNLAQDELNLIPCRVELWGGCAFINFDDAAPPLAECIAPVGDILDARHVAQMRVSAWMSTVLPVNWKLAMEAFMEGYHVMRTHPQLHRVTIPGSNLYGDETGANAAPKRSVTGKDYADITLHHLELLAEGMGGMIHAEDLAIAEELRTLEVPDDIPSAARAWSSKLNAEITARAQARGVAMPDLNALAAEKPYSPVEYIFPHYFMLPMFGNMSSYRIRPLGPESCLFEIWSLTLYPDDTAPKQRLVAPTPLPHDDPSFPDIPKQDYSNLPLQQEGLHARGFDYMRLSQRYEGMISNYQRLIDRYLAGVEHAELVGPIQAVNGRYEAPIKDLDA